MRGGDGGTGSLGGSGKEASHDTRHRGPRKRGACRQTPRSPAQPRREGTCRSGRVASGPRSGRKPPDKAHRLLTDDVALTKDTLGFQVTVVLKEQWAYRGTARITCPRLQPQG